MVFILSEKINTMMFYDENLVMLLPEVCKKHEGVSSLRWMRWHF